MTNVYASTENMYNNNIVIILNVVKTGTIF